jgi:hypothetical protein
MLATPNMMYIKIRFAVNILGQVEYIIMNSRNQNDKKKLILESFSFGYEHFRATLHLEAGPIPLLENHDQINKQSADLC